MNCCDGHYFSYENADGDCASSAAHGLLGSRVQLVMLLYRQSSSSYFHGCCVVVMWSNDNYELV